MADTRSDKQTLTQFAERYTAAWCCQNTASVAGFLAPDGSLTTNQGTPSVGRAAITAAAQSFMIAFPDLVVKMDDLTDEGPHVKYHWTLTGTNTGTGATGKSVRISDYEQWRFTDDGLIAESQGHFDQAAYQKQLEDTPNMPLSGHSLE
jgi:predicted ester cyclase